MVLLCICTDSVMSVCVVRSPERPVHTRGDCTHCGWKDCTLQRPLIFTFIESSTHLRARDIALLEFRRTFKIILSNTEQTYLGPKWKLVLFSPSASSLHQYFSDVPISFAIFIWTPYSVPIGPGIYTSTSLLSKWIERKGLELPADSTWGVAWAPGSRQISNTKQERG